MGEDGDIGALDQVQALAKVPVAAIALALRVPRKDLSEVLAIEAAAPIFWPTLTVSDFAKAMQVEHSRQHKKLVEYFDEAEAVDVADKVLARRIGDVFLLRPELGGHLCAALPRIRSVPEVNIEFGISRILVRTLACITGTTIG